MKSCLLRQFRNARSQRSFLLTEASQLLKYTFCKNNHLWKESVLTVSMLSVDTISCSALTDRDCSSTYTHNERSGGIFWKQKIYIYMKNTIKYILQWKNNCLEAGCQALIVKFYDSAWHCYIMTRNLWISLGLLYYFQPVQNQHHHHYCDHFCVSKEKWNAKLEIPNKDAKHKHSDLSPRKYSTWLWRYHKISEKSTHIRLQLSVISKTCITYNHRTGTMHSQGDCKFPVKFQSAKIFKLHEWWIWLSTCH